MELYSASTKISRDKYSVEVKYSLLWESALGIAAITNESLIDTLEISKKNRKLIEQALSPKMMEHLDYVKKHNTWKTLLQILHQKDFEHLTSFIDYVNSLSSKHLKSIAIPYLGEEYHDLINELLEGSEKGLCELQKITKNHPFLPSYLKYIKDVSSEELKSHLVEIMAGWFETVIEPEKDILSAILLRDKASKENMLNNLDPEEFIEWATDGVKYSPEPSVHKVILIPHYFYRPWNVEADLDGVKIFYYAVANESISNEKFVPNKQLVQRYKALGDETRLKILKMIREDHLSLQELTSELNLGKTTVHHHLKILKSARLVSQVSNNKYDINQSAIDFLPIDLSLYLDSE
ncbi:helix-turn-helix transcriptional regulator [Alkalihalobacillus sp. AL-G]|uniref:ArsR/SmtB family transcription factor n=1 Tax=Alkalihalobacillus sp. AL-G TaxID=2926399 RepID=UPI00272A285A|nr:metalloregulator ArsR/SmtB family transcription factor [Alkalihalobacillus sp. AL-G]WLD94634.1 ArsR family transcriptional regulator [Alkalihalobacillus sp. AL-G]